MAIWMLLMVLVEVLTRKKGATQAALNFSSRTGKAKPLEACRISAHLQRLGDNLLVPDVLRRHCGVIAE